MVMAQAVRFYEQDNKKYEVVKNKELLTWLKESIGKWYHSFIDNNNITFWYEMKYPEREKYNIKTLSQVMDFEQLMYRLSDDQVYLIKCQYRSNGGRVIPVFNEKNITLDELLILFKKNHAESLDFTKLEKCIYDHNCDMELRRQILQMAALKLLYSDRTIPERGYKRARIFIHEFNQNLGLDLDSKEINEAINRDYTNEELSQKGKKPLEKVNRITPTFQKHQKKAVTCFTCR